MSPPEQWRFQWPDGTWIRWNPETEAWEKEISDASGEPRAAEPLDIAPEERWLLDNLEPPAAPEPDLREPAPAEPEARVTYAETEEDDDGEWDDGEQDEEVDEEDDEVALGPRRSAAHVISAEAEEPKSSLRPTILAGAGIGLAVGVIVTMMLR